MDRPAGKAAGRQIRLTVIGHPCTKSGHCFEIKMLIVSVYLFRHLFGAGYPDLQSCTMIKNYFSIALRNLWRNKGFSAITIFGLAIGITTCLLIVLFVNDELSYDRYNKNADRIYRIDADFLVNGAAFREHTVPALLGPVLKEENPQVENYVRLLIGGNILVRKGDNTFAETNACYADSSIFDVFTLPMISGDPRTALTQPHTMVISERMAMKYFGTTDIVGKTMITDNATTYQITGVIRNMPDQAHMHLDFIRAMAERGDSRDAAWMSDNFTTYMLMRKGATGQQLQQYVDAATKKYMEGPLKKMTGSNLDELKKAGSHFGYTLLPLTSIHLYSTLRDEVEPSGNMQYVYIFIAVAIIILLIACVNFMNLSTARSAGRAKEVGVRKVLGSRRSALILQFLAESTVTSFFAMLLGVAMAVLLLPYLNQVADKHIRFHAAALVWILPLLAGVTLFIGLLAGIYPALFLSGFEPIKVLKGKIRMGFSDSWLRNSLVVFQFASAILLIVGTLVIYNQLKFIRDKQLGYDRNQVLVLTNTYPLGDHAREFKAEVMRLPGVDKGSITGVLPTELSTNTAIYSRDAAFSTGQVTGLVEWLVDGDFIPTMGMKMANGRNFSADMPSDSSAILVNETAARLMGITDLNNRMLYGGSQGNGTVLNVIGIVKDFNTGSLRSKIPPVVFRLVFEPRRIAFRVNTHQLPELLAKIKQVYQSQHSMAGQPFTYSFLNDDFNKLYRAEERTGKIFVSFAILAVLIAALGVFGLITYAAEQRTREIGIRKVMGASVTGIVLMLSKDFFKLIGISVLIGSPVAWFIMSRWLRNFAYSVNISWTVFLIAALIAIAITIVSVIYRAVSAATANPINSLKAE